MPNEMSVNLSLDNPHSIQLIESIEIRLFLKERCQSNIYLDFGSSNIFKVTNLFIYLFGILNKVKVLYYFNKILLEHIMFLL